MQRHIEAERVDTAPYGFGETRVATLALLTLTALSGWCSCGVVITKFSGHSGTFRSSPTVFADTPMSGSASTRILAGKPPRAMCSAGMLLGLYRIRAPYSFRTSAQHAQGSATPGDELAAHVAARALGASTLTLNTSSQDDFDVAFATLAQQGAGALLIAGDALFTGHVDRLVALTIRQRIPAVHGLREFAAAGLLMTYGANIASAYRQVGVYTIVINLATAKALGLDVPPSLLARADEVIE